MDLTLSPEEQAISDHFRYNILPFIKSPLNNPKYKPTVNVTIAHKMDLRKLKDVGHKYFDMIWRDLKLIPRTELYLSLSEWLGIEEPKAHFTFMNEKQCVDAIEFSIQWLNANRRCDLDFGVPEPTPYFDLTIK